MCFKILSPAVQLCAQYFTEFECEVRRTEPPKALRKGKKKTTKRGEVVVFKFDDWYTVKARGEWVTFNNPSTKFNFLLLSDFLGMNDSEHNCFYGGGMKSLSCDQKDCTRCLKRNGTIDLHETVTSLGLIAAAAQLCHIQRTAQTVKVSFILFIYLRSHY